MFEEINKHKIIVSKDKGLYYIPNIITLNPADKLFKATNWLVNEALVDFEKTHRDVEERRKTIGYSQKNIDDIEELSIRLGSRTQGYVNQICLMEDILIFEYKRMADLIAEASSDKVKLIPEQDYATLRLRLSSIRKFRNKVVAHTAYTKPKKEDNPETVVRSLLNLFPRECGITLGGNYFSGFSQHISQLPIITIFNWEEEIKPIFEDWKKLFINKLNEIGFQCPLENKKYSVKVAYPHLVRHSKK